MKNNKTNNNKAEIEVAYKYIPLSDGLLFFFDSEIPDFNKELSVGFLNIDGAVFLSISKTHLIPIDDSVIPFLDKLKYIYIAAGGRLDYASHSQGQIEISQREIGKIIAYVELSKPL